MLADSVAAAVPEPIVDVTVTSVSSSSSWRAPHDRWAESVPGGIAEAVPVNARGHTWNAGHPDCRFGDNGRTGPAAARGCRTGVIGHRCCHAQLWGTDIRPTSSAWFIPAEIPPVPSVAAVSSPRTGKLSGLAGDAAGIHDGFPSPDPMGGTAADSWAPSATALISAIAAQIAGPTTAGLTYPAETNPFTNDEFKKTRTGSRRCHPGSSAVRQAARIREWRLSAMRPLVRPAPAGSPAPRTSVVAAPSE